MWQAAIGRRRFGQYNRVPTVWPGFRALVTLVAAIVSAPSVAAAGTWSNAPALIEARAEVSATALDGRIYVAGGFTETGGDRASMEVFDPRQGAWLTLAPLARGLNHLSIAALGGVVYASGGSAGSQPTAGLFAYDPATDSWTQKADLPLRRSAHVLLAAANRLFVVGGVGDRPGVTLEYDPSTDTWTERAPIPTLREHLSAAVLNDRIYVAGGRWASDGNLAALEAYDPSTDTWQGLPSMPSRRGGLTASFLDGKLHVLGGEALDSSHTFPEHEVYDPESGTWSAEADMPTPRHGLGSAVLDHTLYSIAGGRTAGLSVSNLVEAFTSTAEP